MKAPLSQPQDDGLAFLMGEVAKRLDRSAFSQLFDVLAPLVKGKLIRAGMDAASAEDLMQDVMLTLWTKAGLYDPSRGSVKAWVFTIARNARIDRIRSARGTVPLDLIEWDPIDESDTGEQALVKSGSARLLHEALKNVPPEQRQILDMAYTQDMTQADIALRLKLPLGTVKSRMRLAYGYLRKVLETEQ